MGDCMQDIMGGPDFPIVDTPLILPNNTTSNKYEYLVTIIKQKGCYGIYSTGTSNKQPYEKINIFQTEQDKEKIATLWLECNEKGTDENTWYLEIKNKKCTTKMQELAETLSLEYEKTVKIKI